MLVMTRLQGEAMFVGEPGDECLLTVLGLHGDTVHVSVSRSSAEQPGRLDAWTTTLARGASIELGTLARVTLIDVRGEKARLAVTASPSVSVHRFEVWEAMKAALRRGTNGDAEDGLSGSPVPRPGGPVPPSLDVRLDEPPPADNVGV